MTAGSVHSIQLSDGGVPKLPVVQVSITKTGLEGDRQRNLKYHGGPNRAVCLFSLERIEALQAEGHPIDPGSTGENITVRGLDWNLAEPGVRMLVGEAELELTSYVKPCKNIRNSFLNSEIHRISQRVHPGWSRVYARVLNSGLVRSGDPVKLLEYEQVSLL